MSNGEGSSPFDNKLFMEAMTAQMWKLTREELEPIKERMDRIEKSHTPTKSSHRRLTLSELDDSNEEEEELERYI